MSDAPTFEPAPRQRLLLRYQTEILLVLATIGSSLLVWAPFRGTTAIYRVWDGPNYLTIARTLYDVRPDNPLLAYVHETSYFLVHFPVYPLLVRLFSWIGYQEAMLLVSVLCASVAVVLFYRLARDVWALPQPGWLSLVFLMLPPRWLMYRSTGSTEAPFVALALASLLLFERNRTGWASAVAAVAALTRIPGLLFGPVYAILLLERRRYRELGWTALPPLALTAYFTYCWSRTGNFFEYFSRHSEKISPPMPFGFVPTLFKVGWYHQVEFYIVLALAYAVGVSRLRGFAAAAGEPEGTGSLRRRSFETLFVFGVFQWLFHVFIAVEDWSRYFLAFAFAALIVGFHDLLTTKEFKWIFPIFAAMSFVYSWGTVKVLPCPEEMYAHLLWNLGLWHEYAPFVHLLR